MAEKKHIKETKKPKTSSKKQKTENLPPHLKRAATKPS